MPSRLASVAIVSVLTALTAAATWTPTSTAVPRPGSAHEGPPRSCASFGDPDYYSFELERTDKAPSVRLASGRASVSSPSSPFGLAVARDGTLTQRIEVSVDAVESSGHGQGLLVAWAADPNLERVVRLGEVSVERPAVGEIALNKVMVFVTLEESLDRTAERWQGPVVLVGRSRSARIQSMASHGSFEPEPC